MIKKILMTAGVLIVLFSALIVLAANVIQRKAPEFLRDAIGRSLNKKVVIQNITYRFPRSFGLEGFEVREKGAPFDGDIELYVDHLALDLSPVSFSQKKLIITSLDIDDAEVVVRKHRGKLYHVFSGVAAPPAEAPADGPKKGGRVAMPLEIRDIRLKNCHFKFADYDAGKTGFVMTFDKIEGRVREVSVPATRRRTSFDATAELMQERDQRPARVALSGWTMFETMDSDVKLSIQGAHAPYFRPYYGLVTGSVLEDGYADANARLLLKNRLMDLNAGFELSGLLFSSYEDGDQLFGMKADQVLTFLKDSAKKLKFQISLQWNVDEEVKLKDLVRKSIVRSLRETLLGNVGDVLMNAIQKAAENAEGPGKKGGVEERIKKIKDFFKY